MYIFSLPESGRPALWGQGEAECSENRRRDHATIAEGESGGHQRWPS
ncbi:hypothetical protein ACFONI_06000 [Aeromonas media]